jgi:tripartite-type tricarboxylate transporter receptor subunit TctC
MSRPTTALHLLAIACLATFTLTTQAQSYPSKPIRFMVGFPPGGTNDIVTRLLAQKLSELIGQPVVVENRGGANTAIASEVLVNAPPDGYTILLNAAGHATNPSLMKLPFDSIKDFTFITLVAEAQNLLVLHPSLPARSVKELIAISKKNPGEINYASGGTGTTVHLSAELFQYMTGVKWVHIPYKGSGPAVVELMAGQTSVMFPNLPSAIGQARSGKLRAIAVSGARRSPAAPDLPTIAEAGVPGFEVTAWFGVSTPAKTPRVIVDKLNAQFVQALKTSEFRDRLLSVGAEPLGTTPEEYARFVQTEIAKWAKVIKAAGIRAN